jgi:hypothetical protein
MKKIFLAALLLIFVFCSVAYADNAALKAVLKDEHEFFSVRHDRSMKLSEFNDPGSEELYTAFSFCVVDMDRDGVPEVVVEVGHNFDGGYLVLRYEDGGVYGYLFGHRSMQMLKKDGSYHGSNGADSGVYLRINKFHEESYDEETLGEYDEDVNEYKIKGKRVASKKEFDQKIAGLIDENDAKRFEFTEENIEAQLGGAAG